MNGHKLFMIIRGDLRPFVFKYHQEDLMGIYMSLRQLSA